MVFFLKIIFLVGECIRYLFKLVGFWVEFMLVLSCWFLIRKVKVCVWDVFGLVGL